MRALAIETSGEVASLALFEDGKVVASTESHEPEQHAERIFSLLTQLFASAPFSPRDLHCVLLGVGPGSFTGVRVGLALGQGIAVGLGLPMLGVNSLRALASGVGESPGLVVCPLLDARRGEVFAAAYTDSGGELLAPCVLAHGSVQAFFDEELPGRDLVFTGAFAGSLGLSSSVVCAQHSDRPSAHAFWRATWPHGPSRLDTHTQPAPEPVYVRAPSLQVPKLVPSPFQTL